jgi:hypothetical protein
VVRRNPNALWDLGLGAGDSLGSVDQ